MKIALLKNNNWLGKNGYTIEEEYEIYNENIIDIYENPRWYLDNLYALVEYRVSFIDYKRKTIKKKDTFIKQSPPINTSEQCL